MTATAMTGEVGPARVGRVLVLAVFVSVLVMQLWLVAAAGTDIPFHDQWSIEGRWLYPAWREGNLRAIDLLRPFNEHRIAWTLALDLLLFEINGQWDPLVQLVGGAVVRAACAALLAWALSRGLGRRGRCAVAVGVAVLFLPHLAWHSVLWGIESHASFALGFSLLTLVLLEPAERSGGRTWAGILAGVCALVAMSPSALVPAALLGIAALRFIGTRQWRDAGRAAWPAAILLGLGWALRVDVPEHEVLHAQTWTQFFMAAGRLLAWPHVGQPLAAMVMNLPLLIVVLARVLQARGDSKNWTRGASAAVTELGLGRGTDFVMLLGGWAVAIALAAAWTRGGSPELLSGVPSRYVDFIALLPLANAWCAIAIACTMSARWPISRSVAVAWGVFVLIGWLGLSADVMRGIVLPRARDREAPIRLARAFQLSGDPAVFNGQPLLLVPHPNLESLRAVLDDPRMQDALPPSLQPDRPVGPLSRAVRWLLGHSR